LILIQTAVDLEDNDGFDIEPHPTTLKMRQFFNKHKEGLARVETQRITPPDASPSSNNAQEVEIQSDV
jgi:hypothetical protein